MKKLIAICFALLLTLSLNAQSNAMVEALIYDGIELHDEGDYKGALKKYNEALEHEKDNLFALSEKVVTLNALGEFEEAISLSKKLIKKLPKKSDGLALVYMNYGTALDLLGKPKKALKIYDKGIKNFPDYFLLHYNKGITLTGINKYEEAMECFQQSAMLNPEHASTHDVIARVAYSSNMKVPAVLAFCRFLTVEALGPRAKEDNAYLMESINIGVTKDEEGGASITLNVNSFSDEDTPNDFSVIDLFLSLSVVMDETELGEDKTEQELLQKRFGEVFNMLAPEEDKYGFFWEYYAPYFYELHQKEYTEVFTYIISASTDKQEVIDWLEANEQKVEEFYYWSSNYTWKTN